MSNFNEVYIDFDWEFDAPHWCDLSNEDCSVNDNWFEEIEQKNLNETKNSNNIDIKTENIDENSTITKSTETDLKKTPKFNKFQSKIPVFSKKLARSNSSHITKSTTNLLSHMEDDSSNRFKLKSNIPVLRNSQSKFVL